MQIDQVGGEWDEGSKTKQKAPCIDGAMALPTLLLGWVLLAASKT
jgi:hypothetical protein